MNIRRAFRLGLLITLVFFAGFAQNKEQKSVTYFGKTVGNPSRSWLNINQLSTVVLNNGWQDNGYTDWGLTYPKGSQKWAVYITTLMWAYQLRATHEIQIGGAPYVWGFMQPGKVLPGGVPEDPTLDKNRIYRVRPDIPPDNNTADIRSELQEGAGQGEGTAAQIYAQYHKDWLEWPWQDGAPYNDVNHDGRYDPAVDIPGEKGADQSIWFVCNDVVTDRTPWGSFRIMKAVGIELQVSMWAYNRQDPLGYMYFTRYLMINKGQQTLDSAYVTVFCDPDLGYASDDLIASDTTRSMVYVYNGNSTDRVYAPLPPPAFAIDFFQGPVVPGSSSDSAIFRNKWIRGKRNLPMTASYVFTAAADELFGEVNWNAPTLWMTQIYNLCKGLTKNGKVIIDPRSNQPTKFRFPGDPEKKSGWIDGVDFPPGDRRMSPVSGPFSMAPGDTQEVVTAEIVAGALQGGDQLTAVRLLKAYDDVGQKVYNNLFQLPSAPPPPKVTAVELDREIILTWGDDLQAVNSTETYNNRGFKFQGYNVYQFPTQDPVTTKARKLGTFDIADGVTKIVNLVFDGSVGALVPTLIQEGTDSGVKRSLRLKTDFFNGDNRLVNGKPYYFAVTSYGYSPDSLANPSALENPVKVFSVTPHSPSPGTRYSSSSGDTVKGVVQSVSSGGAKSDGKVIPLVIDPTKLTGHTYVVSFEAASGGTTWKLTDNTRGQELLSKQANQSGDDNYSLVDGMMVKVITSSIGMKGWQVTGQRVWTDDGGADNGGLVGYVMDGFDLNGNGFGVVGNGYWWLTGSSVTPDKHRNVLIKFAACDGTWNPDSPPSDDNYSFAYRYVRGAQSTAAKPEFAPFIVNKVNYGFQGFKKSVPFSAWDVEASPPRRLAVGHLENNAAGGLVDGKYWPPDHTKADNWSTAGPREWFFIFAKDYTTTPDTALQAAIYDVTKLNTMPIMWWGTPARSGNVSFAAGDQFLIIANHINTPNNTFTFTAPQNTISDVSLAKDDIKQINVFPNPYYGVNPQELRTTEKFVTFSHLPQKATIRIFNMGGVMVRKLDKDSPSQFFRWDLRNEYGLLVGSGLYIAYIDMPDLGVTKTVKLAIVQEQQVLD